MIESLDDDNCKVTATVSPRTPARTIKLELMDDEGWVGLDTKKTRSGKATFEVSATDASDNWLDNSTCADLGNAKTRQIYAGNAA